MIIRPEAQEELDRIADWLDRSRSGMGFKFLDAFVSQISLIERSPQLYGIVKRCPKGLDVREFVLSPFEYNIVYQNTPDHIVILSITHAKRRGKPWRSRLD